MDAWKNRIAGYGEADPEDLLANPLNWRIHPALQQDLLLEALQSVGWVDDVTVNSRTNFVLDGHLRIALALRSGQSSVPVKYVDLDEREELLFLATFDPVASMALADSEKLSALLASVPEQAGNLAALLEGIGTGDIGPEHAGARERSPVPCTGPACGHVHSRRPDGDESD